MFALTNESLFLLLNSFIIFINQVDPKSHEKYESLSLFLDNISMFFHLPNNEFDNNNYPAITRNNYEDKRAIINKNFSELGLYNEVDTLTTNISSCKINVGDSADDLTDLYLDMEEVIFRREKNSVLDAIWQFKFYATSHTKNHLRYLQLYIDHMNIK